MNDDEMESKAGCQHILCANHKADLRSSDSVDPCLVSTSLTGKGSISFRQQ